jgi:hypothetical protein
MRDTMGFPQPYAKMVDLNPCAGQFSHSSLSTEFCGNRTEFHNL